MDLVLDDIKDFLNIATMLLFIHLQCYCCYVLKMSSARHA